MAKKKPVITEELLFKLLVKNNKELRVAVENQEKAYDTKSPQNIQDAIRLAGIESGETLMTVQLLSFLKGEVTEEQLLKA